MAAHVSYLPPSFMIFATAVSSPLFHSASTAFPSDILSRFEAICVVLSTCQHRGSGSSTQRTSANGGRAIIKNKKGKTVTLSYNKGERVVSSSLTPMEACTNY